MSCGSAGQLAATSASMKTTKRWRLFGSLRASAETNTGLSRANRSWVKWTG